MRLAAICALAGVTVCYGAAAQVMPPDRVYMFHSKATGQCPALDWHVGVDDENHTLSGMIAWGEHMQAMARATGTVNMTNRTFEMKAQEVGGQGRTAEITGQVRQDGWLVANITGPNMVCNNITIPWYRPQGGAHNG